MISEKEEGERDKATHIFGGGKGGLDTSAALVPADNDVRDAEVVHCIR